MIDIDFLNATDKVKGRWERIDGLILMLILQTIGLFLIYLGINEITKFNFPKSLGIIILGLAVFTWLIWLYTTNRFFIPFTKKITVGLVIVANESNRRTTVKKIVQNVILHFEEMEQFQNIGFKILPEGLCINNKRTEKYFQRHSFMYNMILRIEVNSGLFKSIEKIKIDKWSVIFFSPNNPKKKIMFNEVDLVKEMRLQIGSRNWEYEINNSGIDSKKYFENIYQIVSYYTGLYAIFSNQFDLALQLMKPIYDRKPTNIILTKTEKSNEHELKLMPIDIANGRTASILIDLFFTCSINLYNKNEKELALSYFEELSRILERHPKSFLQFINMSRYSYELGNIESAIHFTENAKKIKPQSAYVYLNLGFFSILKNDIRGFSKNYRSLYSSIGINEINWVDVLAFQNNESEKHSTNNNFFIFSTGFIQFVFLANISYSDFEEIVRTFQNKPEWKKVYILGLDILRKSK